MYQLPYHLRLTSQNLQNLLRRPSWTINVSRGSFSLATPTIWDELPATIRESNTLDAFKIQMPTKNTPYLS